MIVSQIDQAFYGNLFSYPICRVLKKNRLSKNMKKYAPYIFILVIILVALATFLRQRQFWQTGPIEENSEGSTDLILFYGQGCSHCANVEDFIKKNQIDKKISFQKREVYSNQENAELLFEKAEICGLAQASVGVPFFWNEGKCLIGDADIIKFFEERIK